MKETNWREKAEEFILTNKYQPLCSAIEPLSQLLKQAYAGGFSVGHIEGYVKGHTAGVRDGVEKAGKVCEELMCGDHLPSECVDAIRSLNKPEEVKGS